MAINKRKVLEAARKYAQKGAQTKALREFEKVLKLDPRDARLRLEMGDAHRRWGNTEKAIETYLKVAEQYMKEGFDARAVAVYKQIHNLDPEAFATYEPLSELYQRMGLSAEAILALQTAADGYRKQGAKREALELLRKMATLDPTNTTCRIKVADLLRQEELFSEAVIEYDAASTELERQGDRDGAASVYERILEIDPDRIETLKQLSENLIARELADRAEPLAMRLMEAQPDEVGHCELLASVYRIQKRDEELTDTYRNLAELHRRRGDDEKARDILQRYVPSVEFTSDPGLDENTAFANMGNDLPLGDSASFSAPLEGGEAANLDDLSNGSSLDELILDEEPSGKLDDVLLSAPDDDPAYLSIDGETAGEFALELDSEVGVPEPPHEVAPKPAPSSDPIEDPEQLLAEASVYLRYGKRDQAIANLEAITAHDGAHRGALEKLGEAYAEGGQGEQAVAMWLRAAELAFDAGDADGTAVLRDRIAAIDAAAAANLAIPTSTDAAAAAADGSPESPTGQAPVSAEGEVTVIDLDAIDASATDASDAHEIDLDDIEIDIDDSQFEEEIASAGNAEVAVAAGAPGAGVTEDTLTDEPCAAEPEVAGSEVAEADVPEPDAPASDADDSDASGPGASSAVVQQISEDLEEADFYLKQGLAEEAEAIYQRVLSIAPNHPHALVRLGEVSALRGDDPSTMSPTAAEMTPEPGDLADPDASFEAPVVDPGEPPDLAVEPAAADDPSSGFDLAAELNDAFDDDTKAGTMSGLSGSGAGFEAVFSEFKKGVSQTLSESDHEAHFDLGIAYREMGLMEDAKGEFRAAMAHPEREIQCRHMLGLCCFEQERFEEAVAEFEQIVGSEAANDEQKLSAHFDLGRAWYALGERESARSAWEAVVTVDPTFCDVAAQLAALAEPEKPEEPSDLEDAGLESFDDLFSDEEADAQGAQADAEPETVEYESLEDFGADEDAGGGPAPIEVAAEVTAAEEPEREPEPPAAPQPVPEPVSAPEPRPEAPPPRKRRKKISFV